MFTGTYNIIITTDYENSRKDIHLPERYQKLIARKLKFLAKNPRHQSLRCHQIDVVQVNSVSTPVWSFSVNMKYRVCFIYGKENTIYLLQVSNHYSQKLKDRYILE